MISKHPRILTLLLLIPATILFAQESRWQLPPSPTGNQGTAILEVLDGAPETEIKAFIHNRLGPGFLKDFPEDQLITMFSDLQQELGAFELAGIRKTGNNSASMELIAESGMTFTLDYEIESTEPYRITGLDIDAGGGASDVSFSTVEELDQYLNEQTTADLFSGVVLIAKAGEILFHKAYGFASKRYEVLNKKDTKFNLGSINKEITGVAVLQLMEKGKLNLDDTIGKYLSGFPAAVSDKVTIRHLLQHKSGWSHYWDNEYFLNNSRDLNSLADYMAFIKDIPLEFEPGTRQQYSNTGYEVLGAIIEAASGQDYYAYMREHIYGPAGMMDTDSYVMDQSVKNMAMGYTRNSYGRSGDEEWHENVLRHTKKGTAAGGGYSTAEDMLRFDRALRGHKLLSERSTNLLFQQFVESRADQAPQGGIGLAGGSPGVNATWELDFGKEIAVLIMCNMDPPVAEKLGRPIMQLAIGLK